MKLLKYNVVICKCGAVRVSAAKKPKCFACGKSWSILSNNKNLGWATIGVLASYYRPQDAGKFCQNYKKLQKEKLALELKGWNTND